MLSSQQSLTSASRIAKISAGFTSSVRDDAFSGSTVFLLILARKLSAVTSPSTAHGGPPDSSVKKIAQPASYCQIIGV